MSEIMINKHNFISEVRQSNKPVLLDFWAPCMQGSMLSQFAQLHPEIKVGKINVDKQQEIAMQFRVMSIPMLAVVNNGKIVKQTVGLQSLSSLEQMVK